MAASYKKGIAFLIVCVLCVALYGATRSHRDTATVLDPTPEQITLSGTYVCLPHADTTRPQAEECVFGLKTDDGAYYAVNFGASADAMAQFQTKKHITAEGFTVIKEALNSDQWVKYTMKGIFTITKMIEPVSASAAPNKLSMESGNKNFKYGEKKS